MVKAIATTIKVLAIFCIIHLLSKSILLGTVAEYPFEYKFLDFEQIFIKFAER
jgi:hypothetical protein